MHCYITKEEGSWVAVCLDYTLAAQGESREGAEFKLRGMIKEYKYDATVGDDRDYRDQLLNRKAPFSEWVKYFMLKFFKKIDVIEA